METGALITYTARKAKGWSRTAILELYDEVQKMVFNNPVELMRYLDTSTGKDPVLTTTTGTFEYLLNVANVGVDVNFVENVYIPTSDTTAIPYNVETYEYEFYARTVQGVYGGATPSVAKVIFNTDPGDKEYRIMCYRFPTALTSEAIRLEVPDQWHLGYLINGVLGLIEIAEHGVSNRWDKFEQQDLPRIRREISTEAHNIAILTNGQGY